MYDRRTRADEMCSHIQWLHYRGESGPPRVTPSRGDTRMKFFLWANLERALDQGGRRWELWQDDREGDD